MNQVNYGTDPAGVEESILADRRRLAQMLTEQGMNNQPVFSNKAGVAKALMLALAGHERGQVEQGQRALAERKEAGRKAELNDIFNAVGGGEQAVPQPVKNDDDGNAMPDPGTTHSAPADRTTLARLLAKSQDPNLSQMGLSMILKGPSKLEWHDAGSAIVGTDEAGNVVRQLPKGVTPDARYGKETVSADKVYDVNTVPASTQFTQGREDARQQRTLSTVPASTVYTQNQENQRFREGQDKPQVIQGPNGEVMTVNARAGTGAPVMGPDGKPMTKGDKPLTETQGNAAAFGMRAKSANDIIADLETHGAPIGSVQAMLANSRLTNAAAPEWAQKAAQAKLNFMSATLRKESGAAISASEYEAEDKKYFPQPGDSDGTKEQKRKARELAIETMRVQAGSQGAKSIGGEARQVVRTGTLNGRKVVQYADGTTDYAP